MSIDDLWYKNAVIYCLDVEKYQDANGDGIGDFEGLMRRLDYLAGPRRRPASGCSRSTRRPTATTATTSPTTTASTTKHGSLGDFVEFMNHADALGIRVIVDLVVNHTSIDIPWFQQARARSEVVLPRLVRLGRRAAEEPQGRASSFPGSRRRRGRSTAQARQYYFHRFYEHQADLNTWNPYVRAEIQKIMGFWLQLGVSGFRMDAVPFLIEKKGAGVERGSGLRSAEGDARLPAVALAATRSCSPKPTCRRTRA